MFVGVHMMMAAKTNTPELIVQPDEAAQFMQAAQKVLRHYSVEATQKTLDWVAFAGIAGAMYLTRGVAISNRRAQEKAERGASSERGKVLKFRTRDGRVPEGAPAPEGAPPGMTAGPTPDIQLDPFSTAGFQPEE